MARWSQQHCVLQPVRTGPDTDARRTDSDSQPLPHAFCHPDSLGDSDAVSDTHALGDTAANRNSDTIGDPNPTADGNTICYADTVSQCYADPQRDANTDFRPSNLVRSRLFFLQGGFRGVDGA